ncbi:regulator of nonsense transcripts 2 isoform X2 [Colletes gigas]|uniref:regulator of nonsense transcripts 2 isoform X2 n=1 Tax=Colletes gigas TaxID=935657 RepID=UPI001C9A556F|nr:regulator of nonsense transcripts 2 isoform X2 [Colletes gigas]
MSEIEEAAPEAAEAAIEQDVVSEEDKQYLMEYVKETEQRLATKEEIRASNLNPNRPPDTYFSKLDSTLKRNTTFVKKLKNFSSIQLDTVLKDMMHLNLTKYVSEVATALVDAKLKMTDVAPAIKVCSFLHQTYAEFSTHFFENWQRILSLKVVDKIANPSKLRVDLRFYAELVNAGIFTHKQGLSLLGSALTVLINMDKEEHNNASIILSFCKHCGEDYAGLVPKRVREISEKLNVPIPKSKLLSPDKQQNVRLLLRDYYNSLCKHLLKEHKDLQAFEKQNRKILQTRGELSSERKEKLESLQVSYERLLNNVQSFSDTLDEPMPELPVDSEMKAEAEETLKMISEGEENSILEDMWGDDETRRFYEVLPDLTVFLPGSYLKEVPKQDAPISEEALDEEVTFDELEETEKVDEPEAEVDEPQVSNISNKILLDAFLTHLPNCVNREMIDNAAVHFLMNLSTKHNKKKLVKALFGVSRIRLDLLPFYSRLAAILYPVMPDVGNDLCLMLKHDFKYHVRKKDQINIESKVKVVRYIGELVKFKLYSKIEALYCLKVLLYDFTHHHIEMACNLLETCGRYLFCSPDSHQRTKVYLEQMMRKKAVTALDSRYVTIIENAYYFVNPPESTGGVSRKDRPPIHEFIRKLLYQDLSKTNTDKVLKWMQDGADRTDGDSDMGVIAEGDEELTVTTGNGSGDAKGVADLHFEESEDCSEAQSEEEWTADAERDDTMGTQENTQGDQSLSEGGTDGVLMDVTELNAALPAGPRRVSCPEDDDFLSALDKMVSDNIQDRMRDSVKPQQVDISVPLHVKSTKKTYEQLQERPTDNSTVDFVLMLRKGNKQQYKNLAVPVSSELAMNLRNREQEQKEEKERVKRLTLNITERQEEEDYQETINQSTRPVTVNLNRERRQKYNHPKGAPDADLIFGPKKIR